jgi:hypothetical protein
VASDGPGALSYSGVEVFLRFFETWAPTILSVLGR